MPSPFIVGNGVSQSRTINTGTSLATGQVTVGLNSGGNGTLDILAGGILSSSGPLDGVAVGAGSIGTVVVNGSGSQWNSAGQIGVGVDGAGTLTISNNGIVTVDGPASNPEVQIGVNAGSFGTVEIDANSTLQAIGPHQTSFYGFDIGVSGTGEVTVTGTNALLNAGGNGMRVGANAGSSGMLEITQHGTVDTGDQNGDAISALSVSRFGDGTVIVDGSGSALDTSGGMYVGRGGTGTLIVRNDASLDVNTDPLGNTYFEIGVGNASTVAGIGGFGIATITSDGSMTAHQNVEVGGNGVNGAMLVNNGGSVLVDNQLVIGQGTTIGGTVYTGNGSIEVGSTAMGSNGTIQVLGDDISASGTAGIVIGRLFTDTGTLDIVGTGALVNAGSQYITIGRAGQGVLAISGGGSVESGTTQSANPAVSIGALGGGSGTLTVADPGSTYTADGQINVGVSGQATVTVSNHGTLITGDNTLLPGAGFAIALQAGSAGTVTVTDPGSEIINTGKFVVGGSGDSSNPAGGVGALTIENGANVQTNVQSAYTGDGADIAEDPGTGGSAVTVTGTDSTWMISSSLVIGQGASGTLNVNDLATVSTGGSLFVADGSILLSGGTILSTQLGLASSTDDLAGNGVVSLSTGLSDNGVVSSAGGTLSIGGPVNGTGSFSVGLNSELLIENAATVTSANFTGSNAVLTIGDLNDFSTPVVNFQPTETIDVQNIMADNHSYDTSDGQLVLESGVTPVGTLTVPGIADPSLIRLKPDTANTGTDIYLACFAPETRIATPEGQKQVQDLQPGDQVRTASGTTETIQWIGHRTLDLTRHPDPACGQPIRIRRSAFAPGVPRSDLRLSPDHALLIDGMLIPIRLLVNNATIVQETSCTRITYFHVELTHHDILLAEGLPAESYLDTGNRGMFENAGTPMILHPDFAQERRETESCAPFVTDPGRVEPIWQRLHERAADFGYALAEPATTTDPEFHIETSGRMVNPVSAQEGCYGFVLPPGTTSVRLVSRSAKANQTKPWIEDRRTLGLMISRILLRRGSDTRHLALDDPRLQSGWWNVERDAASLWRWTNGCAEVPIPPGANVLEVTVAGTVPYSVTEQVAPLPHRTAHGD